MAEINVVPYIDVMLVLLVIFMITAPLLSQGVKVDLPDTSASSMAQDTKEPLQVTVDSKGNFYINDEEESVDADEVFRRAEIILRTTPDTPVIVRGDNNVNYGAVVEVMALLQEAGAPSVGLATDPKERSGK